MFPKYNIYPSAKGAHYDFFVIGPMETLIAIIEYKKMNYPKDQFERFVLKFNKLVELANISAMAYVDAFLFVEWTDALVWHKLKPLRNYQYNVGGRKDRNDPSDVGLMGWIPQTEFKNIREFNNDKS